MGRPKTEINWERFESYCAVQCTLKEIADYFDCSPMTIERKVKEHYNCCFVDVFKRKRQVGLMSLRSNLFKLSGKHPVMAIFLAKNWLGMKEKTEIEHSGSIGKGAEELSDDELAKIIASRSRRGASKEA